MKITFNRKPFEYFLIDNFLNDDHQEQFLSECEYHMKVAKDQDLSASDDDGNLLRKGTAKFLDRLYPFDRSRSSILSNLRNYLYTKKLLDYIEDTDIIFQYWKLVNSDWTMISYYQNADHYKSHKDNAIFTTLLWLNREPQEFNGGNLKFTTYDHVIPYKNNRCLIFPSIAMHEVSEIEMTGVNGRYCISNFAIIDFLKV
jgi:Rps23 Pro-64 3,4-dihydroxylase Tpa1-like proline 4-hydroxylase